MRVSNLPSEYAVARERRRRSLRRLGFVFVVGFGAAAYVRNGWVALAVVGGMVAVLLVTLVVARLFVMTHLDLSENPSDHATFPAQLPVWVVRRASQQVRSSLQDTAELAGKVSVSRLQVAWAPSRRSARLGASTVTWSGVSGDAVSVIEVGHLVPISLLHVVHGGHEVDIWIRRPAAFPSQRLTDFGFDSRR